MEEEGHCYVLCVMPDLSCNPVQVLHDFSVDLSIFCKSVARTYSNYCLYYVSPSWIQRLPDHGVFFLTSEFTTDIPEYRLQFLPADSPPYVLRLYPFSDEFPFAPWNIAIFNESDVTIDGILENFKRQFPIVAESFTCEFEGGRSFPTNEAIMDHRSILKDTKVSVRVTVSKRVADKGRERMCLVQEIIDSEENYVKLLRRVTGSFTDRFFVQLQLSVDIYRRTFKSIGEIKPSHEQFLEALKKVGNGLDAPIGKVFCQYLTLFRVASPHVTNYKTASQEIIQLLKKNDKFAHAVTDILKTVFEDKETVDGLLVSPVQRIPRYPLLLKQLIKLTPDIHWDLPYIKRAYDEISELVKVIDSKQKEQDERNFVSKVQKKLGNLAHVLEPGRRGYMAMENVKVNEEFKASFYLFNDLLLVQRFLPQKAFSLALTTTKCVHSGGKLIINNMYKIPESQTTLAFAARFQTAKREHIRNMCTFGNALMWQADATGAPNLKSACIAAIGPELYLFGGRTDKGVVSGDLFRSRDGAVWEAIRSENEPSPRYECSMVSCDGKLVVFGGRNENVFFSDLLIFDRRSNKWAKIDTMDGPSPRSGHCATAMGSKVWIFGGRNGTEYFDELYTFDFRLHKWEKINWQAPYGSPKPRAYTSCFWIPDNPQPHFAIFGGLGDGEVFNDVWVFLEYDEVWKRRHTTDPKPSARYGHVAVAVEHSVFVIGGRSIESKWPTDAYRLDLRTRPYRWIELPQADEPDEFVNGCCAPLSQYGAALFGGNTQMTRDPVYTYKLRICYNNDSYIVEGDATGSCAGGVTMSRPVYNTKTKMLTSTVDDLNSTLDFVLLYDEDSLKSVMRRKDGKVFWRLTSLLDHGGKSTLSQSKNEFILSETHFQLMEEKPRQIEREDDLPSPAICLDEMQDFKKHGHSKRPPRSRSVKSHRKRRSSDQEKHVKLSLLEDRKPGHFKQQRLSDQQYAQFDEPEVRPKIQKKRRTHSDHVTGLVPPEPPVAPAPAAARSDDLIDLTSNEQSSTSASTSAMEILDLTSQIAQFPATTNPRASTQFADWFAVSSSKGAFEDPIITPPPLYAMMSERPVSTPLASTPPNQSTLDFPAPVPPSFKSQPSNAGLRHTFDGYSVPVEPSTFT